MIIVTTVSRGGTPGTVKHKDGTSFKFDSDGDLQILAGSRVIAAHFRATWTQVVIDNDEDEA